MNPKHQEDTRLTQYLNKLLDEMPLIEPTPTLTDRVMRSLQASELPAGPAKPQIRRRNEWLNSFVAVAATVLLIQSGVINKIMNIDSEITQLTAYIQHLTQFLQS